MTTDAQRPDVATRFAAPRSGFGLSTVIVVGVLCAVVAGGGALLLSRGPSSGRESASPDTAREQYQCPMHPTIVQDHPGECPICGMKLVKVAQGKGASTSAAAEAERKISFYRSPMDPKQTSPVPRKDEMGMDYVPVYEDEMSGGGSSVAGMAVVSIDPDRQQLIGLRTAEVVRGQVGGQVRTVGRVAVDETRVRHVNVKNAGFVERIFVDFVGKYVQTGDPLFTLYSPELLAAQEEFLLAIRTRRTLEKANSVIGDGGQALVDAARRRLALWDVPAAEIRRLEKSGQPTKTLTFYSPVSGVVTKKDVVEGMKLDAGAMPYAIVDLSSVWVLADVYESELRHVKEGTPATLTLKAFPNRTFEGTVVFIDPFLDPQTRTVKVRLTFPNDSGDLRPDMFGEVVLKLTSHEGLVVPGDAIIDSGTAKVVFVAQGEGKFQPRQVELGQSDGTVVEATSGLQAGERVVTRANFLIDSESRLRASLNAMSTGTGKQPESARVLPPAGEQGAGEGHETGHDSGPGHGEHRP